MLNLIKSKPFLIISSIIFSIGIIILIFMTISTSDITDRAAQTLVNNNVKIDTVFNDKEVAKNFTKPTETKVPSANTEKITEKEKKEKASASEINLLAVTRKFCSSLYSIDDTSKEEEIRIALSSVVTKEAYEKSVKKDLVNSIKYNNGSVSFGTVNKAYFRGLNTDTPESYVKFNVAYTVNKEKGSYDIIGYLKYTYNKENQSWLISEIDLERN